MESKEIDYTMMSCYLTCPTRYRYRHVMNLVPRVKAMAPEFGIGIHAALDSWYKDGDVDKAVRVFKDTFQEDLDRDDKRTHQVGEWMICNYAEKYAKQPWALVESETEFKVPIDDEWFLLGRIDKIIQWNNALWIVDHKTTSGLGSSYFKMIEPSQQFPGYVYAMRLMGHSVVGVIVDALLVAKGLLTPTSRARLTPLARYDSYIHDWQLGEWLSNTKLILEDIERDRERNVFKCNYDACTYYGECPYREICLATPSMRERIIKAHYDIEPWHPHTAKRGGTGNAGS